jgi:hypothetical protein
MFTPTRRVFATLMAGVLLTGLGAGVADAQPVIVERPMPAPIIEVVPPVPHPGWSWVPGHYAWRGGAWFWVRGHYIAGVVVPMPELIVETPPPSPGPAWFWVRGHYVWEGHGWAWHRGRWVR